jgi:hypothetical protein
MGVIKKKNTSPGQISEHVGPLLAGKHGLLADFAVVFRER